MKVGASIFNFYEPVFIRVSAVGGIGGAYIDLFV